MTENANDFLNLMEKATSGLLRSVGKFTPGIQDLDLALGGGLEVESLYVLKGPQASGKTSFATHLACSLGMEGYKTLLFTLEDDLETMSQKMLANLTGIAYPSIRLCYLLCEQERVMLSAAAATTACSNVSAVWAAERIEDVINEACQVKAAEGLDVIIIDHLELLDNKKMSCNNIIHTLKNLARQLNVAVFITFQMSSHELLASEADLEHSDVDCLIYLQNDQEETHPDEQQVKTGVKLHVYSKHRKLPMRVDLSFRPLIMRFDQC